MLETFINVISWITVITTPALSIPQLLKLLKDKKTGEVNFISFWVTHFGIFIWLLWGVFSTSSSPFIQKNVVIADGIALILSGITMFLLYFYVPNKNKNHVIGASLVVLATFIAAIGLIVYYFVYPSMRISVQQSLVFGFIAPAFTTFAFVPQLITSIKTKNWKGVSSWLYFLFVVNNIVWILFWILNLVQTKGTETHLYAGLVWQIISLSLFSYQWIATLYYNRKDKLLQKS
ncbi:PQ-loop domain-containing transporter [Mycoplasmopsis ciconiae]|uniref:PQ-loop domain-containing transporter n=1 Tax=Mycoplasmopsis ciconiae TaxID=561067 RepID=A0ABU7MN33_9BACT|nr:PQ-loop domain-containing transporter [Mycoplasmopsis ciconiae]